MAHTPAPWEATDTLRNGKYGIFAREGIVGTAHTSISPAAGKANALVLAAAPELLEALKMVKCARFIERNGGPSEHTMTVDDALDYADAAIAKAEGHFYDRYIKAG